MNEAGKGVPLKFAGVGFGTGKVTGTGDNVQHAVEHAITVGYRYIDCAWIYKTEEQVGKAIQKCIAANTVTRSDLFVSTRLWNNYHDRNSVKRMLLESLRNLQLDYVDLFLIHWPMGFKENELRAPIGNASKCYSNVDYIDTWKGMIDCYEAGLTKAIGVANFNIIQIGRILANSQHVPSVNLIEFHPFLTQHRLHRFCHAVGIRIIAEFPLGINSNGTHSGFLDATIESPEIEAIANRLNKTPSQIVYRYLVYTLGVTVIITSLHPPRITSDSKIHDFQLEPKDVKVLKLLNKNKRINLYMSCDDHDHYPFDNDF